MYDLTGFSQIFFIVTVIMIKSDIDYEKRIFWNQMHRIMVKILLMSVMSIILYADVWNNPHDSAKVATETLFGAFSLPPKRLDPVISYNANEWAIIGQIYEPPLAV